MATSRDIERGLVNMILGRPIIDSETTLYHAIRSGQLQLPLDVGDVALEAKAPEQGKSPAPATLTAKKPDGAKRGRKSNGSEIALNKSRKQTEAPANKKKGRSAKKYVLLLSSSDSDSDISQPEDPGKRKKKAVRGTEDNMAKANASGQPECLKKRKANGTEAAEQIVCLKKLERLKTKKATAKKIEDDTDSESSAEGASAPVVCLKKLENRKKKKKDFLAEKVIDDTDSESSAEEQQLPPKKIKYKKANHNAKPNAEVSSSDAATSSTSEAADPPSPSQSRFAAATAVMESNDDTAAATATTSSKPANGNSQQPASGSGRPGGNWTPSQDAIILSMKEGGESWAIIGQAINRGKNEVRRRWGELKADSVGTTTANMVSSASGGGDDDEAGRSNVGPATGGGGSSSNNSGSGASPTSPRHRGETDNKKATSRGSSASPERAAPASPYMLTHEYRQQAAALRQWTDRDMAVLGVLDRRARVDRWLDLQADFYNATGRMVHPEMLRAKVEANWE